MEVGQSMPALPTSMPRYRTLNLGMSQEELHARRLPVRRYIKVDLGPAKGKRPEQVRI